MDLRPDTILGDYRLDARVGRGGMGTVWRARHLRIGRTVALKVLRDSDLSARFLNEARIQAGLRHPHVATLFDYFEADGHACIAMEFVEGETFADVLRRGPLDADRAVRLLQPVVEAVAYLHDHGVIHRDLKSHNVKVTPQGRVALLDFGIAKDLTLKGLTTGGAVPGTPEYLSPEQVLGRPPDARSDVWALGVLLYELLTGDVPFQSPSTFSLFEQITRAEYAAPSTRQRGVPAWADALVARCLRPSPSDRFANAGALLDALPLAHAPRPPVAAPRRRRRPRWALPAIPPVAAWVFAALAVVALAVAIGLPTLPSPPAEVAPPPPARIVPLGATPADVVIDAIGASAEVWIGGRLVGQTPYTLSSYVGESVDIELRRGDALETVQFLTSPGKRAYTVTLP
ncbi:serine/threonine-protein kinase [Rubrivirga sp. IMCC43871]|uniref:serine/threonine-protein kinase n=1 Tax=Rubrivirga sp. IMCC43871 TaxID=3391575 RepID=UPI00398FFB97